MAYHSWQNKAPSKEYERGHAATFGVKADPFCETCGCRKAWCECPKGLAAWLPDLSTPEKVAEHSRALEDKLGPLTLEARFEQRVWERESALVSGIGHRKVTGL